MNKVEKLKQRLDTARLEINALYKSIEKKRLLLEELFCNIQRVEILFKENTVNNRLQHKLHKNTNGTISINTKSEG